LRPGAQPSRLQETVLPRHLRAHHLQPAHWGHQRPVPVDLASLLPQLVQQLLLCLLLLCQTYELQQCVRSLCPLRVQHLHGCVFKSCQSYDIQLTLGSICPSTGSATPSSPAPILPGLPALRIGCLRSCVYLLVEHLISLMKGATPSSPASILPSCQLWIA
jgi:hypothetical protein